MATTLGCYHSGPKEDAGSGNERPGGSADDPDDPGGGGSCTDECVPGSAACVGNGVQACRRVDGCARYSPVTPCGSGSTCVEGVCVIEGSNAQPNLYVGPETLCTIETGDVYCDVSLCNGGSAAAAASTLKFFLDAPATAATCSDPSIPGEMWLPMVTVPPASCVKSGETLFYDDPTPGTHKLALFADGLCEASEVNEVDNYVVLTPDLTVTPPVQPELWFDADSTLNWDPSTNEIYGNLRVCNFGGAAAGSFFVDFSPNEATTPGCDYTGTEFKLYTGLEPGACTPFWVTMRHAPGTGFWKTARAVVDTNCTVAESNESNTWTWDYF